MIHRLIKKALSQEPGAFSSQKALSRGPGAFSSQKALSKESGAFPSQKTLEEQARLITQKEQNSVKAERQIKDIKKARFMNKYVGHSFSGYVSSITSFGLFINIKQFDVEGLVRFRDLQGFWEPDEFQLSVSNQRNSYRIFFGDEVKVLVTASNVVTGNLDFKLVSHKGKKM